MVIEKKTKEVLKKIFLEEKERNTIHKNMDFEEFINKLDFDREMMFGW